MAERSAPRLVEFLDLVAAESGAAVIHLIARMGSLALSKAVIRYLATRRDNAGPKIRELILAAPDIDAEIFSDQIVPQIAGRGPRMTVYAPRRDYALLASRWLRSGLSRAGFIEGTTPLVVRGVETVDVSAVNTECLSRLLLGHSYVGDRAAIVQDMYDLLRFGKNASERFGNRPSLTNGLPYWTMKPRSA
jgi:esterase/lipase superfamily enzyme